MKKLLFVNLMLVLGMTQVDAQDLNILGQDTTRFMSSAPDLTCRLTDPELAERKNALQKEIFSKVHRMEEMDNGYLFYFKDVEKLLPNLFQYILAEKECCPFFEQNVSVKANGAGFTWKVSGQEGVKEILSDILEEADLKVRQK